MKHAFEQGFPQEGSDTSKYVVECLVKLSEVDAQLEQAETDEEREALKKKAEMLEKSLEAAGFGFEDETSREELRGYWKEEKLSPEMEEEIWAALENRIDFEDDEGASDEGRDDSEPWREEEEQEPWK